MPLDDIMICLDERFAFYPRELWDAFVDDLRSNNPEYARSYWGKVPEDVIYLTPIQANCFVSYLRTWCPKKYPILKYK